MKKIALHSVPRSGSTWVGSILDSSPNVNYRFQPLFSYSHKNQLNENSTEKAIKSFFKNINLTNDEFVLQKEAIKNGKVPKFNKFEISHIIYKEVRYHHILKNLLLKGIDIKIIGLLRNPFSVISSWLNAPKEFRKELNWKIDEEWRFAAKKNLNKPEEFNGYNKWKEVAFLFLELQKKYPNRFYLLNYEDLLNNKLEETKKLFEFSELKFTSQTLKFLESSSTKNEEDAYSVFKVKNKDDQWKRQLPSYIIEEIQNDEDFKLLNEKFKWI